MPITAQQRAVVRAVATDQGGLLCQGQLRALGLTSDVVRAGRWRRIHPGVVATFAGLLPELARVWAALLYAGPGAVAHWGDRGLAVGTARRAARRGDGLRPATIPAGPASG